MADTAIERELVALEQRYWEALRDGNTDEVMQLTDDPCIVAGAQGVARLERTALAGMLKGAKYKLHRFDLKDPQVQMLGDDVAILAYKVHEELTVDGEAVELDAADASTWVRRGDRWLCALHTESIAGDPFGRDHAA